MLAVELLLKPLAKVADADADVYADVDDDAILALDRVMALLLWVHVERGPFHWLYCRYSM